MQMVWKSIIFFGLTLLVSGCHTFVTPIPPLPTIQLPSVPTSDFALFGSYDPFHQASGFKTATPIPVFTISNQRYNAAQDLYSITPPVGWIVEEADNETKFTSPDGGSWIDLNIIKTSYAYDAEAFTQLVNTREQNIFGAYPGYGELDRTILKEGGSAWLSKMVLADNKDMRIFTYYHQDSSAVLAMDCWTDAASFPIFLTGFENIASSLQFNGQAAAAVTQIQMKQFHDDRNALSFEVPEYWTYNHLAGETSTSDTFSSPDRHAAVQSLVYTDTQSVKKVLAGDFTLHLLRQYYGTDLHITSDRILADRSERLEWYSPASSYHGATIFRVKGDTIWIISIIFDDTFKVIYQGLLENILAKASFN